VAKAHDVLPHQARRVSAASVPKENSEITFYGWGKCPLSFRRV
jgi:hypothetical protein